ncbi:hypothetical protein BD779DRAFT_1475392 [Infundibulicybe gibba]|nr:hypothetical protein BD779DRAFT_1475392 [Infundibulicybe gibba]
MFNSLRNILLRCRSYLSHPSFMHSVAWTSDGSKSILTDIHASAPLSASVVVLVAELVSSTLADADGSLSSSGEGAEMILKWRLLLQRPSNGAFRIDFDHAVNVLRLLQQRVAGVGEVAQGLLIDEGLSSQLNLHTGASWDFLPHPPQYHLTSRSDITLSEGPFNHSFVVHDIDDECFHPLDIIYLLDGALVEAYFRIEHSMKYDQECLVNNFDGRLEHLIILDRPSAVVEKPSVDEHKRASRSNMLRLS